MDGNNRWSKRNNLDKYSSYKKGANNLIKLTDFIFKSTKSTYVSAFALSKNNLKRSKTLISLLKNLLLEFVDTIINEDIDISFNIKFIGDRRFLSSELNKKINRLEKLHKDTNKHLIIFINYSGKSDIQQAAYYYHLGMKTKKKILKFEDFLLTKDLPNPDLLIRTGGFSRISDFLIYQTSFTEFFFSKKLWPDFNKKDLKNIVKKYYLLERKFGL
tara:strand:- start:220 stop:867 length:648 start_codon:yes stop_codon:yes gene_type:complete